MRPLGKVVIENRSSRARRVMQCVTIPLNESDKFMIGEPVSVHNTGTGLPEQAQVESWLMPYPSGAERLIRLTYPAVLPPANLRIEHTITRDGSGQMPGFSFSSSVIDAITKMSIVFFCGPKSTHYVPIYWNGATPTKTVDGPRMKKITYFGRVYRQPQAPGLETQFWAEVEFHLYHDSNHIQAYFRWGVDDPRVDSDIEDRSALTADDSEVGFDVYVTDKNQKTARLQPLQPQSNTHELSWDQNLGRWHWVWDKATARANGGEVLNRVYPWGTSLTARCVITCQSQETDQLRIDSAEAWHEAPFYHFGISDSWMKAPEAYTPLGEVPRRQKAHEHFGNTPKDPQYVRARLETESWLEANADSARYADKPYAFNHRASNMILGLWHQNDGQTGGTHAWWTKNPHIAAVQYAVPGLAHHVERGLYVCPWSYTFREVDGSILNLIDHPHMVGNRGEPGWHNRGDLDLHGKSGPQRWGQPGGRALYKLRDPYSAEGLVGTDGAHFEGPWPYAHAAIFGDDGARKIAEQWTYGPLHLGSWTTRPDRLGAVGEQRNWARGATMWAWSLWMFGSDRKLIDRFTDAFVIHAHTAQLNQTESQYPGRKAKAIYYFTPGGSSDAHVTLTNYPYFRPWEMCHAVGLHACANLVGHIRPEVQRLLQDAKDNAEAIFRYGSPRIVDEVTGKTTFTFLRPHATAAAPSIYEPAAAAAIVDNATRQLNQAEMSDNNWSRCAPINQAAQCGQPPTNDGFMRLGAPGAGTGAFTMAMANLVLDGPLAKGDTALTAYVGPKKFRKMTSATDNKYMSWLHHDLFRWSAHRAEDINEGTKTIQALHGVTDVGYIAASYSFPGTVWVTHKTSTRIERVSITTGQTTGSLDLGAIPSGICVASTFGMNFLVILSGNQITAVVESSNGSQRAQWSFDAEAVFRLSGSTAFQGIAWLPQSLGLVVGSNHPTDGPALWTLGVHSNIASKISLPASNGKLILELPDVAHITTTIDGNLLVLTSSTNERHYYSFNKDSDIWGIPRLKTTGQLCSFNNETRDSDNLSIISIEGNHFAAASV